MTTLRSGRRRGHSVRKWRSTNLLVCIGHVCSLCRLRVTDDDVPSFLISTDRWRSRAGECPECGTFAEFVAGYVPERA
jgi:hypothetical protein